MTVTVARGDIEFTSEPETVAVEPADAVPTPAPAVVIEAD